MRIDELKVGRKELFADAKTGKLLEVFTKDEYMVHESVTINGEAVELYSDVSMYEELFFIVFGEFAINTRTGKVYNAKVVESLDMVNDWNGGENNGSGIYNLVLSDEDIQYILDGNNPEDIMIPSGDDEYEVSVVGEDGRCYRCDITEKDNF